MTNPATFQTQTYLQCIRTDNHAEDAGNGGGKSVEEEGQRNSGFEANRRENREAQECVWGIYSRVVIFKFVTILDLFSMSRAMYLLCLFRITHRRCLCTVKRKPNYTGARNQYRQPPGRAQVSELWKWKKPPPHIGNGRCANLWCCIWVHKSTCIARRPRDEAAA